MIGRVCPIVLNCDAFVIIRACHPIGIIGIRTRWRGIDADAY